MDLNWWEPSQPVSPPCFARCFQDTWVFPNILLFYPDAARAILEYRIRMLEGALRNAEEQGYKVGTGLLGWGQCSPASVTQQHS